MTATLRRPLGGTGERSAVAATEDCDGREEDEATGCSVCVHVCLSVPYYCVVDVRSYLRTTLPVSVRSNPQTTRKGEGIRFGESFKPLFCNVLSFRNGIVQTRSETIPAGECPGDATDSVAEMTQPPHRMARGPSGRQFVSSLLKRIPHPRRFLNGKALFDSGLASGTNLVSPIRRAGPRASAWRSRRPMPSTLGVRRLDSGPGGRPDEPKLSPVETFIHGTELDARPVPSVHPSIPQPPIARSGTRPALSGR